jgi:hypothetical protein
MSNELRITGSESIYHAQTGKTLHNNDEKCESEPIVSQSQSERYESGDTHAVSTGLTNKQIQEIRKKDDNNPYKLGMSFFSLSREQMNELMDKYGVLNEKGKPYKLNEYADHGPEMLQAGDALLSKALKDSDTPPEIINEIREKAETKSKYRSYLDRPKFYEGIASSPKIKDMFLKGIAESNAKSFNEYLKGLEQDNNLPHSGAKICSPGAKHALSLEKPNSEFSN